MKKRTKFKIWSFLFVLILIKFLHKKQSIDLTIETINVINIVNINSTHLILKSKCKCRKDIRLIIDKESDQISVENSNKLLNYNISISHLNRNSISCDFYNFFQRGPHLKVVTYSLYGKLPRYYQQLKMLPHLVNKFYPDWIIRIYHDESIDSNIICDLECSNYTNVDFCHVSNLPKIENGSLFSYKINLNNLHSMMWRWYLIGDNFVDIFMSRDADSLIIQREVDSVNEWLNSNKLAHIMRDHHWHRREILGGMWGFYSSKNRELAQNIFKIYSNKSLINTYNGDKESKYDLDQKFLADVVYPLVKTNSTIHDSYFCQTFENSKPFPTKRNDDYCHVGFIGDCNLSKIKLQDCPLECRPKKYLEWNLC